MVITHWSAALMVSREYNWTQKILENFWKILHTKIKNITRKCLAICYHLKTPKKKTRITWKSKKSQVIKYELFCDWVIARPEICKIMGVGMEELLGGWMAADLDTFRLTQMQINSKIMFKVKPKHISCLSKHKSIWLLWEWA